MSRTTSSDRVRRCPRAARLTIFATAVGLPAAFATGGAAQGTLACTPPYCETVAPTVVRIAPFPTTVRRGRPVAITVTVERAGESSPATGTVELYDGDTRIDRQPLDGDSPSRATTITRALTGGRHALRAVYTGSVTVAAATSPVERLRVSVRAAAAPLPVLGRTAIVSPVSGAVFSRQQRGSKLVRLRASRSISLGAHIDALLGVVLVTTASDPHGHLQSAVFYDGVFKLSQNRRPIASDRPHAARSKHYVTQATLLGALGCGAQSRAARGERASASASAPRKKPRRRRLWGDGRGAFRTTGHDSAATVRGTKWLVEDRCASTFTRVVRGSVSVRDLVRHRTLTVTAGHTYLAPHRRSARPQRG